MPQYLASYDLTDTPRSPYSEFINQATSRGWKTWISVNDGMESRLPNTTLVGTFATKQAAVDALEQARRATAIAIGAQVVMEKWIVADAPSTQSGSDVRR